MDKTTHSVRAKYWKKIIKNCCNRPKGMTAKQWLEKNGISEQTYYAWQRRFRLEAAPMILEDNHQEDYSNDEITVSFAELPYKETHHTVDSSTAMCKVGAVIKLENTSIAISDDISERLLSMIIKEVSHAGRCC